MKARVLSFSLLLLLGCGSQAKTRPRAPASASRPTTAITTTTEITSAAMPARAGLDAPRIRRHVESGLAELVDRCGALQTKDDRYATKLHLTIDPNGTVRAADAHGTNSRIDACIAEVARGWKFDSAEARTETNVPLVLERPTHHE